VVVVAAGSIGNITYFAADHYYLQSRINGGQCDRIESIEKAISLNPYNDMYRAELGIAHQEIFISQITQALSMQNAGEDASAMVEQAFSSFLKAESGMLEAIDFVPAEYDNYVFLTAMYNLGAEYLDGTYREKAIEIGLRGVEVEEFGPAIRFHLARSYYLGEQYDEAVFHLKRAAEMDPKWADPRLLLSEIYVAMGRSEDAIPLLESVISRYPDRADAQSMLDQIVSETESATE